MHSVQFSDFYFFLHTGCVVGACHCSSNRLFSAAFVYAQCLTQTIVRNIKQHSFLLGMLNDLNNKVLLILNTSNGNEAAQHICEVEQGNTEKMIAERTNMDRLY